MTGVHTIYQGRKEDILQLVSAVSCIRNILILKNTLNIRAKIFSDDEEC
jgi:hypothetical protein